MKSWSLSLLLHHYVPTAQLNERKQYYNSTLWNLIDVFITVFTSQSPKCHASSVRTRVVSCSYHMTNGCTLHQSVTFRFAFHS